jgi:hypothetical protein
VRGHHPSVSVDPNGVASSIRLLSTSYRTIEAAANRSLAARTLRRKAPTTPASESASYRRVGDGQPARFCRSRWWSRFTFASQNIAGMNKARKIAPCQWPVIRATNGKTGNMRAERET